MRVALLTGKVNTNHKVGVHTFNVSEKRPPTGLGYMKAVLDAQGHETVIIDRYCGDDYESDLCDFDLAGIYCATICMDDIREMIMRIRAKRIAVGGPHWSVYPDDGLRTEWRNKINFIVRGEGEQVIGGLLSADHEVGRPTEIYPPRMSNYDLEHLPRFPYSYFWLENQKLYHWGSPFTSTTPIFTMNTSRGCPYECSFCSTKKVWGRKITMFSSERIFQDIKYLVNEFGAKGIYFREDNFTLNNDRVRSFCEKLLKENIRIEWACETRVDTIDLDLMKTMRSAGCVGFYVGVEHGSQKILDILKKGITVSQIVEFFEWTHLCDIKTAASVIISHPEETQDDKDKFWQLINRIKPSMLWQNHFRREG